MLKTSLASLIVTFLYVTQKYNYLTILTLKQAPFFQPYINNQQQFTNFKNLT